MRNVPSPSLNREAGTLAQACWVLIPAPRGAETAWQAPASPRGLQGCRQFFSSAHITPSLQRTHKTKFVILNLLCQLTR